MGALPPGIRLVLFDAGNTLLFVDFPYLARAAQEVGADVTAAALRRSEVHARIEMDRIVEQEKGSTDASRWRQYFKVMLGEAGVTDRQFEAMVPLLLARHQKVGLWIHVRPWTKPVLETLRRAGYRMAVVSNADGRVESWLVRKTLGSYFETVLDSHVVGVEKPDPRIFEMALDRTGFAAREAIHVGDLYSVDVLGARRAGITPVLLDPMQAHPATDCLRIRGLSELTRLLPRRAPARPRAA
ncbi:MAG: HAD-IA family hydrolase [Candidatus Wallbacteria bacterium]|nr:HAD-IA family hydrolase [Candidatus Wallbacteria bacterium]